MARSTPVWIGTGWKMNKTLAEARAFAEVLAAADKGLDPRINRFILPPFTTLRETKAMLKHVSVKVGAQNMHWAENGQWTGEISPLMLKDCDADMVELGHSERREFFAETDETVGLKTEAAVRHGLIPLICIGESREQRDAGRAAEVLERQTRGALAKLTGAQKDAEILLAYEPIWAIGVNGVPASADYADARQAEIADVAEDVLGRRPPVLYGGSVNPGNCEDLIRCRHIDGLFIGRSAWDARGYIDILAKCAAAL